MHQYLRDEFTDVIWTDETTFQLETDRRFCCRKRGHKPRYKPRPKTPTKLHIWAGISYRGSTRICVYDSIMNADLMCRSWKNVSFHFCKRFTPIVTVSCKTMTLNIHLDGRNSSSLKTTLIGGKPLLRVQMQENLWHELKVYLTLYAYTYIM